MQTINQRKICLLGDFAVGKTSLIRRYVHGRFDEKYLSTIGVTVSRKVLERATYQLRLLIWDLAGGEKFSRYQESYLRGAAGALVVVDLTRPDTLDSIGEYAAQLLALSPEARVVVLGNKTDLVDERRISGDQIEAAAAAFGSSIFLTSAKSGEAVEAAFHALADLMQGVK